MSHVMKQDLDDPGLRGVTVREVVKKVVWARNCQLSILSVDILQSRLQLVDVHQTFLI